MVVQTVVRVAACRLTAAGAVHTLYIRQRVDMDVRHELRGQLFEWDVDKAAANLVKHEVSFETACEVFFDPFVRLMEAGAAEEWRDAAIGYTEDASLLFVVHVVRGEERIRLISARAATTAERRQYEEEQ